MEYLEDVKYLPNEIIYYILINTPRNDILKLCANPPDKYTNDICNDQLFWQQKTNLDYPLLYKELTRINTLPEDWRKIYINGYKYDNLYLPNSDNIYEMDKYTVGDVLGMIVAPELSHFKNRRMVESIYILPVSHLDGPTLIAMPKLYSGKKLLHLLENVVKNEPIDHINFIRRVSGRIANPDDLNNDKDFHFSYVKDSPEEDYKINGDVKKIAVVTKRHYRLIRS